VSKIAIKGATTGTGTFTIESPATNTDRTLTLPDEAGTVLTSASDYLSSTDNISTQASKNIPIFMATMSSNQSIGDDTFTKVNFNTEVVDSHSWYDTSTYRFTPQVAGWYLFETSMQFGDGSVARFIGSFVKNGTGFGDNRWVDFTASPGNTISFSGQKLFHMNGSTDYMEAYGWIDNSGTVKFYSSDGTHFGGYLVRAD